MFDLIDDHINLKTINKALSAVFYHTTVTLKRVILAVGLKQMHREPNKTGTTQNQQCTFLYLSTAATGHKTHSISVVITQG